VLASGEARREQDDQRRDTEPTRQHLRAHCEHYYQAHPKQDLVSAHRLPPSNQPRMISTSIASSKRIWSSSDEEPGSSPTFVALDRSRAFWTVIGYAVVFGLVLAIAGLAFLGLVKGGTKLWFTLPENPDWFSGSPWWVAVTAAAGVLVGVLRHVGLSRTIRRRCEAS